jgi:iron complex transport system ATP-binding protein
VKLKRTAIALTHCNAQLGSTTVFSGLSLKVRAECWTSVVGPNGAGKSTLLKVMAGLLESQGQVQLMGQSLPVLPARLRAQRLAWLGQNEAVTEDLTVYDVAMLGRLPHQAWLAPPSAADHAAVQQALEATQAWDWRDRPLGELSGGERQRVLLARALAVQAQILLMDEPLANLDAPHQADWLAMVRNLAKRGTTVVSVLHEIGMALHADDVVVMAEGRIEHHGPSGDPATHAALVRVFEGRIAIHRVMDQWIVLSK